MNTFLLSIIAGLLAGSAFVLYFAVETPCFAVSSPDMKLFVDARHYETNKGSFSGRCGHFDGFYNIPRQSINITNGKEIRLLVQGYYTQPDMLELRADRLDDNSLNKVDLTAAGRSMYLVNLPSGDYGISIYAKWNDRNLPVQEAIYYSRIMVQKPQEPTREEQDF